MGLHDPDRPEAPVRFATSPDRYRHWRLDFPAEHGGAVARLVLDVDEGGGLRPPGTPGGYSLKLNSYDLGVDIELADALQGPPPPPPASSTPRRGRSS
jgi:benzoyl-CoA-dihydrodiol lyase